MKTLKKTLCLVLAVVMAVGVLILPANADMETYRGFDDKTEIDPDYELAVATLTGMGIITGKSDTAFVPSAPVTRAEAASLIVATLTTPAGRALAVLGSDHPFTDVGEAHKWADGNIGYAYEAGIVTGKTDTTFVPNATVTGFELLTMLMKATGYEPKNATASWTSKAVEFAREYDIFETGLEDVIEDPNKALTREETAQMIWQAINHSPDGTVTVGYLVYVEKTENDTYDAGSDSPIDTVDSLVEALLVMQTWKNAHEDDVVSYTKTQVNTGSIGDTLYHLQFTENVDTFGRSTYGYKDRSKEKDNIYSTLTVPYNNIYTDGVKLSDALKALGYKTGDEVSVSVTTNGTPKAATKYKVGDANGDTVYKPGQRVEVYDEGTSSTKAAKIIVIDTYVHVLTSSDINKATATEKANVKFGINVNGKTITCFKETSEFTKGQVVIFTAVEKDESNYNIVDMNVAKTFSGKVTASSASGYIRVDNVVKYKSANAKADGEKGLVDAVIGTSAGYAYDKNTEFNFYEDNYGHIIYATTEEPITVETNYIYVITEASQGYNDGELTDDEELLGKDPTAAQNALSRARVIMPETGEVKVVTLAIGSNDDGYFYKNVDGSLMTEYEVGKADELKSGFYEYAELADGTLAIIRESAKTLKVELKKNTAKVGELDKKTLYANGATVVVVSYLDTSKNKTTVTTLNGYGQFPSDAKSYENAVVVAGSNNVVTKIYVVTTNSEDAPKPAETPVNYAIYVGPGETTDKAHYMFFVDGAVETYEGATNLQVTTSEVNKTLEPGTVYNLSLKNGAISAVNAVTPKVTASQVGLVENDYIVVGDTVIYLTKDTVIVDATGSAPTVADAVEKDAYVTVYVNKDTQAEFILIVPKPAA